MHQYCTKKPGKATLRFLYSYLYIICFYQGVMEQTYLIVELLAGEIYYSLKETQIMIEMWPKHYNTIRLHSSPDYQPPAPAAVILQTPQIKHFAPS
jgi:hypothetical protein